MEAAAPPPHWLSGAPAIRQAEYVPGFVYDEAAARRVEDFIESLCCHTKDSPTARAGEPVRLIDWHRDWLIRPVYGWREDTPERLRRYRVVYIEVPKKNAKSSALAMRRPSPQSRPASAGSCARSSAISASARSVGMPSQSWRE